ncbi:hypothetical protein BU16DRAFT_600988 [Lophium mytilinum]|uniref:Uncharacterized protein n=1 Tax=Lophium mytilinum TaxID=390894 RepID=A0A6A6Q9K2_9PEZI|nr:hypothetical protein BU16DRAFT_600988 [Lophium mytilinum]
MHRKVKAVSQYEARDELEDAVHATVNAFNCIDLVHFANSVRVAIDPRDSKVLRKKALEARFELESPDWEATRYDGRAADEYHEKDKDDDDVGWVTREIAEDMPEEVEVEKPIPGSKNPLPHLWSAVVKGEATTASFDSQEEATITSSNCQEESIQNLDQEGEKVDLKWPWAYTLSLRLHRSGTEREVQARVHGQWIPLEEVLSTRPIVIDEPDTGNDARGYQQQWDWWHANGKAFELLKLPGEMRNTIYRELIGEVVYPYQFSKDGWSTTHFQTGSSGLLRSEYGTDGTFVKSEPGVVSPSDYGKHLQVLNGAGSLAGLLVSSKKVNEEVSSLMWKELEFRFQEGHRPYYGKITELERFMSSVSQQNLSAIRKVVIQGNPDDMLDFFKRATTGRESDRIRIGGAALRKFSRDLELEVRLPHRRYYNQRWDYGGDWHLKLRCWREVIGTVLWMGRRTLAHFDKVRLTGCLSPAVHELYLQLLDDIKHGRRTQIREADLKGTCIRVGFNHDECSQHACTEDWCVCQGVPKPQNQEGLPLAGSGRVKVPRARDQKSCYALKDLRDEQLSHNGGRNRRIILPRRKELGWAPSRDNTLGFETSQLGWKLVMEMKSHYTGGGKAVPFLLLPLSDSVSAGGMSARASIAPQGFGNAALAGRASLTSGIRSGLPGWTDSGRCVMPYILDGAEPRRKPRRIRNVTRNVR